MAKGRSFHNVSAEELETCLPNSEVKVGTARKFWSDG